MTDERQKKTTDQYRSNWDAIFKKNKDDYQDILSTEECVLNVLEECCNQGRNCPNRKVKDANKN